jgi:sugar lactone lactonase YvrE
MSRIMKPCPSLLLERGERVRRICFSRSASLLLAAIFASLLPFVSARAQSLFVSIPDSLNPNEQAGILRFNAATTAFEVNFSPGISALGIAFGPTGDLFAASHQDHVVYRIDGTTGQTKAKISGAEVSRPTGVTIGRDGDVYVTDNALNRVVRYDGRSGVFKGVFATVFSPWDLAFGPDGDLYVASSTNGNVLRYDGTTGASKGIFASSGSVTTVHGVAFGPDGNLFVSASTNDPIFRFNGTTGAFMGAFTSGRQLVNALGIVFGPDGDLYVADSTSEEVDRFDGTSGAFKLAISNGPLDSPFGLAFTPEAKVLNISTRLAVQTGDNVLIAGFIITGEEARDVIVRAIGPSLADAGVTGALADPSLELHDSTGALIAANNNWRVTQLGGIITGDQQAAIEATTIAPTDDLESAIVATLAPGTYTAIVRGANDGTGIGLAEVYDLNQATPSKLANISTRGFVDTGENVMIGGFVVRPGGGTESSVILRAIGPSLGSAVENSLADPTLELHDSSGALVAANDNWKDSQQAEIQATKLAPTDDAESALVALLPPGAYTAIVRGKENTTGVALIELYSLN